MGLNGAVSTLVGVVALVAAALMWLVGEHSKRLVVLLVMVASTGLAGSPVGHWMRVLADWANREISNVQTRWFGAAVGGLLAGAAAYVVAIHLKKDQISGWTLLAAAFVPIAVTTIPGPLGTAASTAVAAIVGIVAWPIAQGLGIA